MEHDRGPEHARGSSQPLRAQMDLPSRAARA